VLRLTRVTNHLLLFPRVSIQGDWRIDGTRLELIYMCLSALIPCFLHKIVTKGKFDAFLFRQPNDIVALSTMFSQCGDQQSLHKFRYACRVLHVKLRQGKRDIAGHSRSGQGVVFIAKVDLREETEAHSKVHWQPLPVMGC